MRKFCIGRVYGLDLIVEPQFIIACLGVSGVAAALGMLLLHKSISNAVLGGLAFGVLHALSVFLHDFGHAIAARSTGYPMTGIEFGRYGLLATTLYPPAEPPLPGRIHIRRALGGPLMSFGVAVILGGLTFVLARQSVAWWVVLVGSWHNLLSFTLQVLLPVPWADGGTLAQWRS